MLTKIDICSMALLKLGESPIQSLSDDTPSSQLARTLFDSVADTLISLHPWRFATRQLELTKNTQDDFLVPTDVLRVLDCPGHIIGNKIKSTSDKINITALVRTPVSDYPSYFSSLLATRLAMEFCISLSGDQTVFRMLVALYETELQSAKFIDGTQSSASHLGDFSLVNARF